MEISKKVLNHASQNGINSTNKERYLKSWKYPKSFKRAVNAKCIECVCFDDVINQIRGCTVEICPLHKLRPFQ